MSIQTGENRDPRGALQQLRYNGGRDWPMVPEWNADQALRYAYLSNIWVWRCANAHARWICKLPARALDANGRERPNSPLGQFLRRPNPTLTWRRLIGNAVINYLVAGRMAWELEPDDRDRPRAAWPLAMSNFHAYPTDGGPTYFRGFSYGRPGEETRFKPDEVLYLWRPSLTDPREPESVLQAARLDVSIAVMQDRYEYAFLRNDARPATVVAHQPFQDAAQRRAFRAQFTSEFQGPEQAGKTIFTEFVGGDAGKAIDIQTVGATQRDAQFSERMDQKIRAILVAFGTPLSILGDASKRTFSNAEQERYIFAAETMEPEVMELQDDLNLHLARRFGDETISFDLSGVEALQTSRRYILNANPVALVDGGVITLNESRAALALPPVPDGDVLAVTAGDDAIPAPPETPKQDDQGDEDAQRTRDAAKRQPEQPLNDVHGDTLPTTRQGDPDAEARDLRLWQSTDAVASAMERSWVREFERLFRRQQEAVLSRLTGKRGRQWLAKCQGVELRDIPPADTFDYDHWMRETVESAQALYETVINTSAGNVAARFGLDFDLNQPWVEGQVRARSNRLAGQVTRTTYRRIQKEMADGALAGEGIPEIATRIKKVFADASTRRAVTIARTEVISAYNGAGLQMAANLGPDVCAAKKWIPSPRGDYRDWHLNLDPKVIGVTEAWSMTTGATMNYPGDPSGGAKEVINCRCAVGFMSPDEYASWTADSARTAPLRAVRAMIRMVDAGATFDSRRFEAALVEVGSHAS